MIGSKVGSMKYSTRNRILLELKNAYPLAIHKGELERRALLEWNAEADQAARRCRELVNDGLIERIENKNRHVEYRYIPPKVETRAEIEQRLLQSALL